MIIGIILLVILIFGILVFVHEFGHFIMARRGGVDVEEFGFGFPPRLVGIKRGSTVYSINLIPLGGFVKMKGEAIQEDTPGSFGAASFMAKSKILLAGVTMNAFLAYVVLVWLCLTGLPPVVSGQYSFGTPEYAQPKQLMAVTVDPKSPGAKAGLQRGDMIISGNGKPLGSERELLNFTKAHAGQKVTLEISHDGVKRSVTPTLNPPGSTKGFLGVGPLQTYQLRYDFVSSLVTAAGISLQMIYQTFFAFIGLIAGLFVHGQVSENISGPVGIVVLLSNIVDLGLPYVLIFVASISVSLAVINILPLPALDGGRYAMVLAQRLTGKALSQQTENIIHAAG
ncbi:MAG TPA: site-2 protease family protein, partial [Candidatus Polarisedimenticolaceae bacterium]|nr:site-2 protease family protein [Candidatus Polarisedimenticolaceae bacterium]